LRFRLVVARGAEAEIEAAASWWRDNRPNASALFYSELARAFELITAQPRAAPEYAGVTTREVRRLHLHRVRYHLYYRVKVDKETVEILALWHTSRGSSPPLGGRD